MNIRHLADAFPGPGRELIAAVWVGTAVFATTTLLSVLFDSLRLVGVVVDLVLFAAGCVAFLSAYVRAVQRSRTEEISLAGLYFLTGTAPNAVRRSLMSATAVQLVVAVTAASLRPFTPVAFGILVPMYGLGMAGLWAAHHGKFPPRKRLRLKKQKTR